MPHSVDSIFDTEVAVPGSVVETGESISVSGVTAPFSRSAMVVRILKVDPGAYRSPAIARLYRGFEGSLMRFV